MSRLMLRQAVLGPIQTNVYFVKNTETRELFMVDPAANAARIKEMILKMDAGPVAILLTHGHFDHIMAAEELRDYYHIPIYACRAEADMLRDPVKNMTEYYRVPASFDADRYLDDNDEFTCAGFRIQVMHTPGHTVGGCCYYLPEEKILFSGDTLFCGSVGRTDFPGGSMSQIIMSLHRLIDNLPEETEVYPGHNSSTTIGDEKRDNPFV